MQSCFIQFSTDLLTFTFSKPSACHILGLTASCRRACCPVVPYSLCELFLYLFICCCQGQTFQQQALCSQLFTHPKNLCIIHSTSDSNSKHFISAFIYLMYYFKCCMLYRPPYFEPELLCLSLFLSLNCNILLPHFLSVFVILVITFIA